MNADLLLNISVICLLVVVLLLGWNQRKILKTQQFILSCLRFIDTSKRLEEVPKDWYLQTPPEKDYRRDGWTSTKPLPDPPSSPTTKP